ncbi:hypothetical protein [Borreliella burgdorferi]|uniref:hypothetical protein n=1 Tax=Borreliella burgdorferi TaxID=139 RepID=UPI000412880B|nr:hypothetical protein [Borreliella burgdorferi]
MKKMLTMEAREREQRSRGRLERINGQSQAQVQTQTGELSNNQEQDTVNTPPEKIYLRENRNNIYRRNNVVKDFLGFKTIKGIPLKSLGIDKKSNLSLIGLRR